MGYYWDIFNSIFDVSLQDDAIPTCLDNHLQHILELSVPHLSHTVGDMVIQRTPNRVRKVMDFSSALVVLRHKAKGRGDERQGWVGNFFYSVAS